MPWSDWVTSPPKAMFPGHRRRLQYSTHDGAGVAFDLLTNEDDMVFAQALTGPPGRLYWGTQYDAPEGWDNLDQFPPELWTTILPGVDFVPIPGRDPSEPFLYVDYDPDGVSVIDGWNIQAPVVYDRDFHFDLSATLWIDPATAYDVGAIGSLPVGAPFATIEETTPAGTVLPAPPDPGETLSFTIGIYPDRTAADVSETSSVGAVLNEAFFDGWPTVRVQLPRWRYWKPDILPLRQYPRNDGLRGGAPSARPTSRQSTTARRTYL